MLDDYGRRLLAEMGVDVYLPRAQAESVGRPEVSPADAEVSRVAQAAVASVPADIGTSTVCDVLVLCERREPSKLLGDLLRALARAGLHGGFGEIGNLAMISQARGLLVLGESLARELGPGLSAQQQNAITWVVAIEPSALARSAAAKRALWGEIKRLSRTLVPPQKMV